jgi:alpha-1,2-mannosyltransferase
VVELERGRERRGGVWIGVATALKAFPGLLILYLALTQRWKGAAVATGVAAALTLGTLLPYGPLDAVTAAWRWLSMSLAAPGTEGFAMQKLGRLVRELHGPTVVIALAQAACLGALVAGVLRGGAPTGALYEAGMVVLVAVLLSPIGWYYYFGLMLPAGAALVAFRPRDAGRLWWLAAATAAVLLAGVLRNLPLPAALAFAPRHNDTVGALALFSLLLALRWRRRPASPGSPAPAAAC